MQAHLWYSINHLKARAIEIKSFLGSAGVSPTATLAQNFNFATDAGHKITGGWLTLVEEPVITDQLFKSTNLCPQRSRFKEVCAWAAVGTRQVRLAVVEDTTRRAGMDLTQYVVCL